MVTGRFHRNASWGVMRTFMGGYRYKEQDYLSKKESYIKGLLYGPENQRRYQENISDRCRVGISA
ncbi:hypothetical protein GCM10009413_12070 [Tatumella punctata]